MTTTATAPPGVLRIGLARGAAELRQFFRQREHAVFTFALPAFLMVLLGTIFDDEYAPGITASQVFAASIIGAGIISTSFVSMGIGVALDREDGTLKRLHGTPMPASAYFLGKVVLVGVSSVAQLVLMLAIAVPMFDLRLPDSPADWLNLAWLFVLGTVSCSLLGVAASGIARSVNGASAGMQLVYVGLQFASGVFVNPITMLPTVMVTVSSFFPVKWICQGFRSVFLPDHMAAFEMAGQWELGKIALILGAWCVAGTLLCRLTFRWTNRAE